MYSLATVGHQAFAARWLLANASAADADGNVLGEYGRFFDGPPPAVLTTAWQTSGGIAVTQAAAGLDPGGHPADPGFWARATFVTDSLSMTGPQVRISFTGRRSHSSEPLAPGAASWATPGSWWMVSRRSTRPESGRT
jgi:hypothetical protein